MSRKKNSLVKNASVLMVAAIISRIIGLLYRRPMGQILGPVGMGYYGYASNLYSILLMISAYSIPMAVSKIASERLAKHQFKGAHRIFKGALLYAVIVGGVVALIAFFGGSFLLPANQQNAVPALRVLAPTIFFSAVLGVFRGYFQAHHNMTPTSISQIAEQIVNALVSILAAFLLVRGITDATRSAIRGAAGGTTGTAAGVIAGLLFMLFVYNVNRGTILRRMKKDPSRSRESYGQILGIIVMMATPIILTTFINNASNYLDSYIYSSLQGVHGAASEAIAAAYGEFSNYYVPVINIPLAMASASAAALMPEVSAAMAVRDRKTARDHIAQTVRLTMFICIPATVGLTVLAFPVMGVLFPSSTDLSAKMLMTGSIYVIFTDLATITGSVLQAIGRQRRAMINAAVALGINLLLLVILLNAAPGLDIYAVMIANIVFSVAYCLINALTLRKYLGRSRQKLSIYALTVAASAIMGAAAAGVYYGLFRLTYRPFICLVIAVLVGIFVYLVVYVVITRTTKEELAAYPMGRKLVKFFTLIRVYR